MVIETISIASLQPHVNNARTHSKKQIKAIASSIRRFGFVTPVIITDDGVIVAGHGRVEAAKTLEMTSIPAIRFAGKTPAEIRAYMLADNQHALKAGWNVELLAEELAFVIENSFEIEELGFEIPDVDIILDRDALKKSDPGREDELPTQEPGPTVSRLGDIWQCGKHRLIVGDSTDAATFRALMGDDQATMMLTDPPFNVAIDGHVSGLGRKKHREFAFASGEMTPDEFIQFLSNFISLALEHLCAGALSYVFMDWRHMLELLTAAKSLGLDQVNLCVWNKSNAGMGSFYRSKHELCSVFKRGNDSHLNNIELGKHGRSRSNVWDYAGVNTFRRGRAEDLADHPTVKPAQMIADAIRDASKRGDVVLDPFAGSGTILIAAEMTGRRARAIEIDPIYADVAVRRFEAYTGKQALLDETGETFEVAAERRHPEFRESSPRPISSKSAKLITPVGVRGEGHD